MATSWLFVLIAVFVTTGSGTTFSQQSVGEEKVETGCLLSTLKKEFLIRNCSPRSPSLNDRATAVAVGTSCTVRCTAYPGMVHRECVAGGYWNGPRLNCHRPSQDKRRSQVQVRRIVKRGLFSAIGRIVRGFTCAVVDDLLSLTSCDGGGGGGGGGGGDTTPPKITCHPPSMSRIIADEGKCEATVRWENASASDSKGIKSILQTRPSTAKSGSIFRHGRHTVVYVATDNSGLTSTCSFEFEVEVVQCESPRRPRHGHIQCNTRCRMGHTYGTTCTASCDEGYKMTGHAKKTCRRNGKWTVENVTCSRKKCPQVALPRHAKIECSDSWSFRSTCVVECEEGYRLLRSGTRSITCRGDQTWSGIMSGCEDNTPPEFKTCPSAVKVNADRGQNSAVATWPIPVVTDNANSSITPRQSKGLAPGSRFTQGLHEIQYTAQDASHNDAIPCWFTVTVGKTTCPSVQWPRKMKTMSCPQGLAYGASCTFACEPGYDMIGENNITCERNASASTSGFWSSAPPTCDVKSCNKLDPPLNGALAWENWFHGIHSRLYCNDKYDIPRGTTAAEYYICDDSKGTWTPSDTVPDCTARHNPSKLRLGNKVRYYSGNCSSEQAQQHIKQEFISSLNSSGYNVLCRDYPGCGVDNVLVECGEVTREKRDLSQTTTLHRVKRAATHEVAITFDFFIELRDEATANAQQKWKDIDGTLEKMKESTLQRGRLNLSIRDFPMQMKPDSFETVDFEAQLQCPPGSVPRDDSFTCAVCPTRTYFDSSTSSCIDCPVGSYNDRENQTSCKPCPDGHSTLTTGTRDVKNCIAMCSPGSYSDTGLVPCAQCAVGTYQSQRNTRTCTQCPHGTVTSNPGSVALQDCQAFQLNTLAGGGIVTVSDIVKANTDSWSVTFWLKVTSNNKNIFSLTNSGVIFQLKTPSALSYDIVGTVGSTGVNLVGNKWSHIAAVWDGAHCTFQLYRGGRVIATKDMTDQCSVVLSPATTLTFGYATSEDSFAGSVTMLSVWNSALNGAAVRKLFHSCLSDDTSASFTWQMVINSNMRHMTVYMPTNCDVNDNCDPDPCHGYKCEDKLNGFVCHCKGGFTGKTCDIPPDYCLQNLCLNGASCLRGSANYTCQCAAGFRGSFCTDEIVNGGYGPWSAWSSCSKTCEGGAKSRSRQCNDPVPDLDGLPCVGPSSETQDCNVDQCPECSQFTGLPGLLGTMVNCSQEASGNTACHVSCKPGMEPNRVLANPYFCGPNTNYVWSHMLNQPNARLPSCTNSTVPKQVALRVQVGYNVSSSGKLTPAITKLTNLADLNDCVHTGVCKVTTSVANTPDAQITTTQPVGHPAPSETYDGFKIILLVVGTVHRGSPVSHTFNASAEDAAAASRTYIINNLEALALLINQSKEDGSLCFPLAGHVYCPIDGSLRQQGVQICPPPTVMSIDRTRCVNCPPGSYAERLRCVPCEKGHYQDKEGQTGCKPCPANKMTALPGATSIEECKAVVATTTTMTTRMVPSTVASAAASSTTTLTTVASAAASSTTTLTTVASAAASSTTTLTTVASAAASSTTTLTTTASTHSSSGNETDVEHAKYPIAAIAGAAAAGIGGLVIVIAVIVIYGRRRRRTPAPTPAPTLTPTPTLSPTVQNEMNEGNVEYFTYPGSKLCGDDQMSVHPSTIHQT